MINRRLLLSILYFAITGCNIDCVEPGLQSRNTSVNVDVPVYKADEGTKIHWVDSGQVIGKGEKIKFTLDGLINFCPLKKGKNPRKVLVPAVFCADGSMPSYSDELINNSGLDKQEVCENVGFGNSQFYSKRRYVDTGIKVNFGDKLRFRLVPREITIDYDNPEEKGISFDDNCYKAEKGDDKATIKDMLNGGTFYCEKNGKRTAEKFPQLSRGNMKKREVLVGNGYTPYDNKVYFNKGYIQDKSPWMHGSLLDLRRTKIGLNELCDGKDCDFNKVQRQGSTKIELDQLCKEGTCDSNEIKKYSSYELNCYYQNVCYTDSGIWNYSSHENKEQNCVSSIRYSKYDKGNKCDMYSYLKEIQERLKSTEQNEQGTEQVNENNKDNKDEDDEKNKDISRAEALVAKISDPGNASIPGSERDDMKDTAKGTQCLPKRKGAHKNFVCSELDDNFRHFSLRLNHDYAIDVEDVKPDSSVMLAIADYGHYYYNRGGYHVEITRSCEYINGQKLYMYLGDEPPKDLHGVGTSDFQVVGVRKGKGEHVILDVISGEHFQDGESKKIYFGIDVRSAGKDDITDKNGKYYENNKYIVTLFVKRKINDFISSNINKIFDFIKKGVIGDSVKVSYEGYVKGLLQGVRALLTLYVIFTVVGYTLGTIQLNKFDFIVRVMKIAFIAFALSDRSWELFGMTLSKLFMDGSTYLVDSFSGYIEEGGKRFAFLDLTAGVLFTGETWLKFLSLMLAGPFGFVAFMIILYSSFTFLQCIIGATFKYVISTILVALLLSLTPLFIIFILFQQTKFLFDNWVKTLAHVAVQPVILFSSLSILNQLMYSVLYNLTNFSACYQCLISINFLSYDLCIMKSILPLGYNPGTGVDVALSTGEKTGEYFAALPIDLIQAFIYLIIASTMEVFVGASEAIAQAIFGAGYGIINGVSNVANSASQSILSTVGLDRDTQGSIQRIRGVMHKDPAEIKAQFPMSKESQTRKSSNVLDKGKPSDGKDVKKKQKQADEQLKTLGKKERSDQEDYGGATSTSGKDQQSKGDEKKS
ncbi:conjugal transfer protein TrbL [Wolbachia endosymbiont of Litomosoides brasiliensis]|uniref:type IV secretion system protein n=1 Tax=Wolbachia endosymbiont of Litomosoides brasiliensis TaxID=1812117 RepID=UPI00158F4DD3|nr:type IV secretion system protein [Wolbachia endosymbiont of Litomosoides brasiliensis]NUY39237.1 conjugal transfer protein TrbL [Wolbachia endosymbiont of Litomosoides brasiliensis]